jgi:hypothetical protein
VKNKDLAGSQRKIQVGTLRHHADEVLDLGLLLPHVVFANPGLAGGWAYPSSQDSDRGGFARAVRAKKAEDLSGKDFKRKAVESRNLGLRLLPAFRLGAPNQTTTSSQWGRGAIDFAQVLSANANRHAEQPSPVNAGLESIS